MRKFMKARYNTMFDVAFSLDHSYDDPYDIPVDVLIAALEQRLFFLRANPEEAKDAFGVCDTYANGDE